MNRKQRNDRKSILFIREHLDTLYQERSYADQPRQIPLKSWIKRLARVHRHNRIAAVQMFEARFGELEAPLLSKTFRFLNRMNHYQQTGFMFPIFMYQ